MKDYIPEISEIRMIRRAPDHPPALSAEDAVYLEASLRAARARLRRAGGARRGVFAPADARAD